MSRNIALSLLAVALAAPACSAPPGSATDIDASAPATDGSPADAAATPLTCADRAAQPADSNWTIRSSDRDRTAAVHVPPGYDPSVPTAVVLNFHGFSSTAAQQAFFSEMIAKSDSESFIAVHATGVGIVNSWNGGACCGTASTQDVDDVAFVSDLIDELGRRLCVDSTQIFATGFSNGGFLSHRLACELSDRIAAIAPVSGVIGIETCEPSRAMPVMHFHGTADLIVPYGGNSLMGFPSVDETAAGWSTRNNCNGSEPSYDQGNVQCQRSTGCDANGDVTVCTISGGGHTWPGGVPIPGGGITTNDISATDAMWDFFVAHPHPAP